MSNDEDNKEIPALQRLYDSPYILLLLGLLVMFVFYTIWGLLEVVLLPTGQLP
ncbi:MAG: hypothetical protein IT291_02720 [Deltaproteobacteria bacterium]|nr:hypothetical protein [Deltaproteobacteria bacterium]